MKNPDSTLCIEASGIEFGYEKSTILKDLGITLEKGEIIGILGPNGSGKTTFMKCLNRILTPSQGTILLNGDEIKSMKRTDIAKIVGYVPQNSNEELTSPTVYEVVMMGRKPRLSWQSDENDEEMVWKTMEELDVAHLASHGFDELSSGQTQRVLMARAIVQEANVLLLDEPTSNLDIRYQLDVMELVVDIVKKKNIGVCAIIHDLDLALRYCDKVLLINNGKIVAFGPSHEVITEKNVLEVYGVKVHVEDLLGRRRLIVL